MKNKDKLIIVIAQILIVGLFLTFWEWGARAGRFSAFYTSYPTEIARDLYDFLISGALAKHTSITLREALSGLLYGSIIGVFTGVIFGQFPIIGKIFTPLLNGIYGIPQLTLAPVYILWFGLGLTSKIFLAGLMVFFCVFFSTYGAIQNIEQKLIESASLLGASAAQTLWHVVLPSCMPWIISGIRSGVGASLIGAIVGEYMGAQAGFGWMVAYATSYFNIKRVMSCIVILLFVGIILNLVLDKIEKYLLKWKPKTSLSIDVNRDSL